MAVVRTIFAFLIGLSLATVPARAGSMSLHAPQDRSTASMSDCCKSPAMSSDSAMDDCVAMAAADTTPMPSKGDGRGGDCGNVCQAACFAFCNSATAFPTMAAVTFNAGPGRALALTLVSVAIGHGDSPDPYPPKSITLI
jgi:hypothetical protein